MTHILIYKAVDSQENSKWDSAKIEHSVRKEFGKAPYQISSDGDFYMIFIDGLEESAFIERMQLGALEHLTVGKTRLVSIWSDEEPLWNYQPIPQVEVLNIERSPEKKGLKVLEKCEILITTATETEKSVLLSMLKPIPGEKYILSGNRSGQTFYLGCFGNYQVAYVVSDMGSSGQFASAFTMCDFINFVDPKLVFSFGIAFGVCSTNQGIGDVLVASSIQPYDLAKIGEQQFFREEGISASPSLVQISKDHSRDFRFQRGTGFVEVHVGPVLSGGKLINNRNYRDELLAEFPKAIGGEMEGHGIYAATNRCINRPDCILIKSICDWADGNKNDDYQVYAANTSIGFGIHMFTTPDVFSQYNIEPVIKPKSKTSTPVQTGFIEHEDMICYLDSIEGFENCGEAAKVYLDSETRDLNKVNVYVTKKLGRLYAHCNYIKENQVRATKLFSLRERNLHAIFINLTENTWPSGESLEKSTEAHMLNTKYFIDEIIRSELDLANAKDVRYVL